MRPDAFGIFWQDVERSKRRGDVVRPMPPIPDLPWKKLDTLPNLARAHAISVDIEARDDGLNNDHGPGWARGEGYIAGISIGADNDGRWYFPIRHSIQPEDNYDAELVLNWARRELSRPEQIKVFANALYDVGWLAHEGVDVAGDIHDVQFAEALLDSDALVALEVLGRKYLDEGKKGDELLRWLSDFYGGPPDLRQRANIWRSPPRLAAPYAVGDADLPLRILEKQWPLLERHGLFKLYRMECRLIPLLVAMRFAGVSVDVNRAEQARDRLLGMEKGLQQQLRALAGFDVNTNAADSLSKLFKKFDIPFNYTKPTASNPKGRPSFTKEFLKSVKHPVGKLVTDIRKVNKTRVTFIESYILQAHVKGKIYPSIHPLKGDENGTVTGRFAMSNPNGQNLPSRDEEMGQLVRGCCIPDLGHKQWRKYDWSQLQYRFLAHYAVGAGSAELRQAYVTDPDADYHAMVQQLIKRVTGIELDRKPVKNTNFGFVFGMGIKHLAEMLGLSLDKAKELAETYHQGVPYVKETLNAASQEAQDYGVITTILGRRILFDLWEPARRPRKGEDDGERPPGLPYSEALARYGDRIRRAYTHKALNYRLQGSEGDYMKACMLRAWDEGVFAVTGVPRLTVHDELDFSDPGGVDDAFEYLRKDIMEGTIKFRVPMSVGCDVGPTWGACL